MLSTKIAYRNLPKRKARTALTVLAVVLGVALLVGINLATASATSEFTSYINKFWGQTDIVVSSSQVLFDSHYLATVQNVSEVQQAAARLVWFGTRDNRSFFPIIGVNGTDFDYSAFNITGTKTLSVFGQATLDDGLAQKYGLGVGSTLSITAPNFVSRTNVTISLSIVGLNHPLRNIGASVYMNLAQLQADLNFQGQISHIYATLADSTRAPQVRDEIQRLLGPTFNVNAPKAEAVQRIAGQTAGFELGLNVMVAVALVVCSFIVFNTLFMTVNERTYEIGVIRAVGTSRSQIFRIFLLEGLLIGAIGSTVGIFAGLILSRGFTLVAENLLQIPALPLVQLTPTIAIFGLGTGFASVLAGALYPAASASRINIIQAIRPSARNSRRQVPEWVIAALSLAMLTLGSLEASRLTPFHVPYLDIALIPMGLVILGGVLFRRTGRIITAPIRPLSRTIGYIASRNGRRRLLRNTVSFGMITITLSFVIMLGGIQGGVQTALEAGIQEALGADIILVANQSLPVSFAGNLLNLQPAGFATPPTSIVTPLGPTILPFNPKALGPTGNSTSVGVLAIDPTTFPDVINYQFVNSPSPSQVYSELTNNSQALMLPDSLASRLDASVGQTIDLVFPNKTVPFSVAGIFTGPVLQYIQFGNNFASDSIVVSFSSQKDFFAGTNSAPVFLINLKPQYRSDASTIAHDIAASYPSYNFGENSLTLRQLLSIVRDTINRIFTIILLVLYFALLIATLGISATMIMNVQDRRREIGLLRSQGMSRRQISGLFLSEGVLLGVFGFLLAIPGGLLLLLGATNSTTLAGFYLPFVVPYSAMLQAFGLAILAVLVGSLYPSIRASRMEITRALEQA